MPKNVSVGRRASRGLFVGLSVGLFGGTGVYLMAEAVNALAGSAVLNPIAFLLLILGGSVASGVGIDLSSDIAADVEE